MLLIWLFQVDYLLVILMSNFAELVSLFCRFICFCFRYVLVAGLVLGTQNRFSPEVLGILASSALAWTVVEIAIEMVTLYVINISTRLKTLDLLAYAGYKYVG